MDIYIWERDSQIKINFKKKTINSDISFWMYSSHSNKNAGLVLKN